MEIPDRKGDIVERGQRVSVLGLEAGQTARVASCRYCGCRSPGRSPDRRRWASERRSGINVAERVAVGVERKRESSRVAGGLGYLDQVIRCRPVPPHRDPRPSARWPANALVIPWVSAADCEPGAAPFDLPFGLADVQVRTAEHAIAAERQRVVAAAADHQLAGVAVAHSCLDPSRPTSTMTLSRPGLPSVG